MEGQLWVVAFAPEGRSSTLRSKIRFFFNLTEKLIDIIIDLDEIKLFVHIYDGRKISTNCSKLGSDHQILINPAKVIFEYFLNLISIQ